MKTFCTRFLAIFGLLFSFILLTSQFLSATETFAEVWVTENSEVNSNQLKYSRISIRVAGSTNFMEVNQQVLAMGGLPAFYVNSSATTGSNNGSSWANAYTDLQSALAVAVSGDIIWVAAGTYYPTPIATFRNTSFQLKNGVAIYGGFAGNETMLSERDWVANETILSGDINQNGTLTGNSYSVVTGSGTNASAVIDGFTITGGNADGTFPDNVGGGMYNQSGSPTVSNIAFLGNRATTDGGGMYNESSSPTVTNSTFSGNEAWVGGGMHNRSNSNPTIVNSTFSGNMAVLDGGGVFNSTSAPSFLNSTFSGNTAESFGGGMCNLSSSSPAITNCTFSENSAFELGGGMYNYNSSSPIITNSIFSGNDALRGGGMYNSVTSLTITNCTFLGNKATINGGGMYNFKASTSVTNSTFSGNQAGNGGGLYNFDNPSPTISNSIIWNNSAAGSTTTTSASVFNNAVIPDFSHSLIANSGGSGGSWENDIGMDNDNNIDVDPLFVDPPPVGPGTDGDLRLLACSPAINAGDNSALPMSITTDLDGNPRFYNGGIVDMGAYEFQGDPLNITDVSITNETCPGATDGSIAITATCVTCSGGNADIRYSIDNLDFSNTTGIFTGLTSGNYSVYVQDINDITCTVSDGPYTINIEIVSCVPSPDNNDCASAQPLVVTAWPATSNTTGTLTGAFGSGWGACAGVDGPDVFYTFNAETTNHYIINLNAFGGFVGVAELYDACSGTLIECFEPAPNCVVPQSTPGFPSDPTCEAAVCGDDPFCCTDEWDGFCANAAFDVFTTECAGCMGGAPAFPAIALDLPAGDYTLRVRNMNGQTILDDSGNFLINIQSFPTAQVQSNPANFLYACNTTDRQLEDIVGASPQSGQLSGILDYEWYIERVGGGFSNVWQRGAPNYSTKLTWLNMQYGETYNVFVRLLLNIPGQGPVWGVHQVLGGLNPQDAGASTCTITTSSSVTQTEVRPPYTPTNLQGNAYAMCNITTAFTVADAENYEWEFDNGVDPAVYYVRGAGNPHVKLSWVNCLKPNNTYMTRVRAQVNGQWGTFGNAHPLDMAPTSNTALRANICGTTRALTQFLLPNPVCIADSYEYELVNTLTSDVHTATSTNAAGSVLLNTVSPPLLPGAEYSVRVKATQCGEEGDFSSACNITIAGPQSQGDETPQLREFAENSATLYPNPNAGTEVRVELNGLGDGNHEVMIQIYDVYGKLIQTEGFGHAGSAMSRLVRFEGQMAMGMYMVQIVVDGERFVTERLVVN